MDIAQIISHHLTALMESYPERDTLVKVSKAAKVGFGTVRRAKNGDGNLTVHNLALIAAAFHRKPQDLLIEPTESYPSVVPISPSASLLIGCFAFYAAGLLAGNASGTKLSDRYKQPSLPAEITLDILPGTIVFGAAFFLVP